MPIREYECPACGSRVEQIEYSPLSPPICQRCDEEIDTVYEMVKVPYSQSNFSLKGEGWTRPPNYVITRGSDL